MLQMSTRLENKTPQNYWFNSYHLCYKCLHVWKIKPLKTIGLIGVKIEILIKNKCDGKITIIEY